LDVIVPSAELAEKVAALRGPQAYPDAPPDVEVVETHMSYVFLTPTHAYKMKKPVRYDFLDFSTLELRRRDCQEELRLNSRLAPGIYLDVPALRRTSAGLLQIGSEGEAVEWLVRMHRLPKADMLDERLRNGTLTSPEIDALADRLAAFYLDAPPEALPYTEHRAHLVREVERDRVACAAHPDAFDPVRLAQLLDAHLEFLDEQGPLLAQRIADGRLVEGHGDLRPQHVCLLQPPVVFDCIEFNRRFRIVDPVAELAFLAMECELLGATHIGPRLLRRYAARTGDSPPSILVDFYKSRSAAVRARLCLLHTRELERAKWDRWLQAGHRYLELAHRYAGGIVGDGVVGR
jgi:aminoglycoside phosphotransferase family enzyme